MKNLTKGDRYLIALIIILSLISLVYIKNTTFDYKGKYVSIQLDGYEIKEIIFDKKNIGKTIPIKSDFGYNLIELGDDEIRIIESDCPDQLAIKEGYISEVGEILVCLPNKLIIEIKGFRDKNDIDYISH